MKTSPPSTPSSRAQLTARLKLVQMKADVAKKTAKTAKAELRQARKTFKQAKKTAKAAKRALKELKAEIAAFRPVRKRSVKKAAPAPLPVVVDLSEPERLTADNVEIPPVVRLTGNEG